MNKEPTGFSGHSFEELEKVLDSIKNCSLPIEVFDAFLADYKRNGDLKHARYVAMCEWDC